MINKDNFFVQNWLLQPIKGLIYYLRKNQLLNIGQVSNSNIYKKKEIFLINNHYHY